MTRVTIRVNDDLKERMEEHSEINWSEYIRKAIEDRVSQSDRRRIQKFVKQYDDDLPRLFTLHLIARNTSKQRIYETIERLFDEELDEIVDEVDRDLDDLHITGMYKRSPNGERYGNLIKEEIEKIAGEEIRAYIRDRVVEAPEHVKDGVSLLPHFVRHKYGGESAGIKREALKRTWSIRSDADIDPDEILQTGLVFKSKYDTNAYNYYQYKMSGFALDIVEELERHPSQFDVPTSHPSTSSIESFRDNPEFHAFLEWMGGTSKYIDGRSEKDEIQELVDESELTEESFKTMRKRLIDENMLILSYRPHRSSAGGRSSRPARWRYEFTDPAQDYLAAELLE